MIEPQYKIFLKDPYILFDLYTLQIMTRLKCCHVKQIEFSLEEKLIWMRLGTSRLAS